MEKKQIITTNNKEDLEKIYIWMLESDNEVITLNEVMLLMLDDDYSPLYDILNERLINRRLFVEYIQKNKKSPGVVKQIEWNGQTFMVESILAKILNIKNNEHGFASTLDILHNIFTYKNNIRTFFESRRVDINVINEYITEVNERLKEDEEPNLPSNEENRLIDNISFLAKYGQFLQLNENEVINLYGKDKIMEEVKSTLTKIKNNKVILVGDVGVGKNILVEGLANQLLSNTAQLDFPLLNVNFIYKLEPILLFENIESRIDLHNRIKILLRNLYEEKNVLYVENVEVLFDLCATNGNIPFDDMLDLFFKIRNLPIIFTTQPQYYKSLKKDGLLSLNHFTKIDVESLTEKDIFSTIKEKLPIMQSYYSVHIEDKVLETFIEYSTKANNTNQPAYTMDKMDSFFAVLSKKYLKKLKDVLEVDNNTIDDSEEWFDDIETARQTPYMTTMADVFDFYGVSNPIKDFDELRGNLKKIIIGQDTVIDTILDTIEAKDNLSNLLPEYKLPTNIIAIGPTGVGKTETFKMIAKKVRNVDAFEIPAETLQETHRISDINGSPRGYIGSEETPPIVQYMQKYPNGVIIINEIEKANDVFKDLFLSMMEGKYRFLREGRDIDTTGLIFGFTSNVGANEAAIQSIGFNAEIKTDKNNQYMKALEKQFKPEFLGRMSNICVFEDINREMGKKILRNLILDAQEKLRDKNIKIFEKVDLEEYLENNIDKSGYEKSRVRGIINFFKKELVKQMS